MIHVGYSLIDQNNIEIQYWGNQIGILVGKPYELYLPNGDIVCSPSLNASYSGYKLVERYIVDNAPSIFHIKISETIGYDDINARIVVTFIYSSDPVIVPPSVSPLQMRKALNYMNLRDTIENYVSTLSRSEKDSWEYATSIDRNHPLINQAAVALNMTVEQIDDLFRQASLL